MVLFSFLKIIHGYPFYSYKIVWIEKSNKLYFLPFLSMGFEGSWFSKKSCDLGRDNWSIPFQNFMFEITNMSQIWKKTVIITSTFERSFTSHDLNIQQNMYSRELSAIQAIMTSKQTLQLGRKESLRWWEYCLSKTALYNL